MSYIKPDLSEEQKDEMQDVQFTRNSEYTANERLFAWLENSHREINGPRATRAEAGWPSFCQNPIKDWPKVFQLYFTPEGLQAAKNEYDKYHSQGGGKRRKRTKFNKRKSSSRVLSKSRRRTHRK